MKHTHSISVKSLPSNNLYIQPSRFSISRRKGFSGVVTEKVLEDEQIHLFDLHCGKLSLYSVISSHQESGHY